MNHPFDELTKNLAQSVTRRVALKKFGVGLAGMALACFGLGNSAGAATKGCDEVCVNNCMINCLGFYSKSFCRKYCRGGCGC